jgi:hypothetical protein
VLERQKSVLEKSDKFVRKRMKGRIVLDKKRIISNVWQVAVAVAVAPPPPLLGLGTESPVPAAAKHLKLFFFSLTQFFPSFSFQHTCHSSPTHFSLFLQHI